MSSWICMKNYHSNHHSKATCSNSLMEVETIHSHSHLLSNNYHFKSLTRSYPFPSNFITPSQSLSHPIPWIIMNPASKQANPSPFRELFFRTAKALSTSPFEKRDFAFMIDKVLAFFLWLRWHDGKEGKKGRRKRMCWWREWKELDEKLVWKVVLYFRHGFSGTFNSVCSSSNTHQINSSHLQSSFPLHTHIHIIPLSLSH